MVNNSRENMIVTLWLLSLTLITASECVYAAPTLVEYRRSEDNTPLNFQDDFFMGEERPKRTPSLSVTAALQTLRDSIKHNNYLQKVRLRDKQIAANRETLSRIGKRGHERNVPVDGEYYGPYQQHLDIATLIRKLADANHQPNNVPADTYFDESNDIDTNSRIPFRNMHFNIDEDAQNDRFFDVNDERAWLHEKQQRHFNQLQKQQNTKFLRQWDNKQLNDRTQAQVAAPQAQQQQRQEIQDKKQQRQPDNSQQPDKSFDNDERFMLQTFATK